MPTYEYVCSACGHAFERFESITAAPNKTCEKCKKKKAVRKISGGGGFLFKGSGFYVTDYKKSNSDFKSKTAAEGKPAEAKAETKSDSSSSSSDTKSAPAATPAPATAPAPAAAPAKESTPSKSGKSSKSGAS